MSKRLIAIPLMLSAFLLSGCAGAYETDDIGYVLTMGIDAAPSGYRVTYEIAVPRVTSGAPADPASGVSDKEGGSTSWITNSIEAPTIAEARTLLSASMSRLPNLTHVTALVIGEAAARRGIGDLVSYLVRNPDFRPTIFLIVVAGDAEQYLQYNRPKLELTVSKFYESYIGTAADGGFYLKADLHEFYIRLKNIGGSPYATYSAVNAGMNAQMPEQQQPEEQIPPHYIAGQIPRTGTENPAEFLGLALFKGDKLAGVLDNIETRAVAMLKREDFRGYSQLIDPLEKSKKISIILNVAKDPEIHAQLNQSKPVYQINVPIEVEIVSISSGINYEDPAYRSLLEEQISQLLEQEILGMLKHTQDWGCDPVGLGMRLRSQFPDYNAMKAADFVELYKNSEFHVSVETKIRRTGMMWRTTPNH